MTEEAADAAVGSTISVKQLSEWIKLKDNGEKDFVLIDVREPNEYEINRIPGSVLIPKADFQTGVALEKLPQDKQLVLPLQVRRPLGRGPGDREGRGLLRRGPRRWRRGRLGRPDRPEPAVVLELIRGLDHSSPLMSSSP